MLLTAERFQVSIRCCTPRQLPTSAISSATRLLRQVTMSSCLGFRKSKKQDDTEALLPQYADDTSLQRSLHQKMHSYQMVRALSKGYMPSTEQLIVNLRTLLASDFLNPDNPDLSDSGRLLLKYTKQWLANFIEAIRHKNDADQIQDFIWFLSKSRISVDTEDLAKRASKVKAKADAAAGMFLSYSSLISGCRSNHLSTCMRRSRFMSISSLILQLPVTKQWMVVQAKCSKRMKASVPSAVSC